MGAEHPCKLTSDAGTAAGCVVPWVLRRDVTKRGRISFVIFEERKQAVAPMPEQIERFSASYVYERNAFVLIGIPGTAHVPSDPEDAHPLHALLCVTQNLIQRGCPTPPTAALQSVLGPLPQAQGEPPHLVDAANAPAWSRTIKGAPDGHNPALRLWEALLEALPSHLAHLRALILPEAPLAPILEEAGLDADEVKGQQVDLHCPLARLVVEVDGSQHESAAQKLQDARRDELLRLAGVRVLRIPASRLAKPKQAAAKVVEALNNGVALHAPASVHALGSSDIPYSVDAAAIETYESAMRLQVAFLELMRAGVVDPAAPLWRIGLAGDASQEQLQAVAQAALEDVFGILSNLAVLADVPFTTPEVEFMRAGAEGAQVTLDVSAFRTWDEADLEPGPANAPLVRIRSAHDPFCDGFRLASAPPIAYGTGAARHGETEEPLRFFLHLLFGHEDFKPGQIGIIRRALARKSTLGILPTGSGKSVCYQMACLLQPAVSFVVCPIISLIQDQDRSLQAHGVNRVARLDSQMTTHERACVRRRLGEGRLQLIWVSPERFQDAAFRQELVQVGRTLGFGCAVIDEVHCLSEWGHDFRVSYLLLKRTFTRFCPSACLLGLTATASRDVLADLKAELGIASENIQTASVLSRPELRFHIRRTTPEDRLRDLDAALDEAAAHLSWGKDAQELFQPQGAATICGIVFANTRSGSAQSKLVGCEEIKDHLLARNIQAETYHSGRGEDRTWIQRAFMENAFPIMVATKSFGMGIDKPNVRFTIHANLPWSVEAFYQEAGRAGRARTGNDSDCFILYVPDEDADRMRKLFAPSTTIEEIHQLQPQIKGDLSTIFFLWTKGFASFEDELKRALSLLSKLDEARGADDVAVIADDVVDEADVRPENAGMQTEKALYKLAVCGFVDDWTRDWNRGALVVELSPADGRLMERAERSVEAYIARHSPGFSFTSPRRQHERYVRPYRQACESGDGLDRIAGLIGALLAWTNDTIVFSRRAAIGNMLRLCEAGLSDEELGAYLDGYFKLDADLAIRLEKAAESPDDLPAWLDVFYESVPAEGLGYERRLRSDAELASIVPLADRFRESYPDSIGVEWVSLMAKLLANAFTQEDVCDQFAFVLDAAHRGDGPAFDELVDATAALVERCGEGAQAAYDNAIAAWKPGESAAGAPDGRRQVRP